MKLFSFKSIRSRLIYWFLVLTLIPLLLVLIVTYFQRVEVIQTATFDKLTAIRDLKVERLNAWLFERKGDMNALSQVKDLTQLEDVIYKEAYNDNDQVVMENCRRILKRYLQSYDSYYEIFILNPENGKVLVSTNEHLEGEIRINDEYFTRPMLSRQLSIKDIYYSQVLSEYTMDYSTPIFCSKHSGEHIVGILVAHIDLKNSLFEILAERVGLGETGETLIVNSDVIALNELRWHEHAPLNLQISAEPAVNAANGMTGITVTPDYRKEDVLAAYTFIRETSWGFVCKQDLYELNQPIREMILNFVIIFIITATFIIFISISISRTFSKPITEMNTIAGKLSTGDFSEKVSIPQADELGSLGLSLNNMANSIESRLKIQDGISQISEVMIGRESIKDFGDELLRLFLKLTNSNIASFYILNETSEEYEYFTSIGANEDMIMSFDAETAEGEFGIVMASREITHLKNIPSESIQKYRTTIGDISPKEIITIPIVVENTVVALISLASINEFDPEYFDILKSSTTLINTSYSNILAGERTRILADQLSRINHELEAKTEELQEQSEELQNQTEELQRTSEELQEQNMELEVQRKQVESANNLKSEFLSNMSHELRTPLNSIMALSRVLINQSEKKLDDEESSYLEIIERNGKRLLTLINEILDLSKIEAGKMDVIVKEVDIASTVNLVKENLQSLAEEKNIEINVNAPQKLHKIETDESKLHQVLTNIMGNAVKFTEKGSVDIRIIKEKDNVLIAIKDTGIGISKEMLAYVFDEFRQADGTASRQYEGTGLGLAIAKKLVNILGGEINVTSKLGKGSEFTIVLPMAWHDELSKTNLETDLLDLDSQYKETFLDKERSQNILMIEDNPTAIAQVKSVLEKENFMVEIAGGGQEAFDILESKLPDGIILDLMMPEIDGFQVLEYLKSTNKTKNIPVLVLTAKDLTQKDLQKLSSSNVQQLVQKGDININSLLKKIKSMLSAQESQVKKTQRKEKIKLTIIEDNTDNMATLKAILGNQFAISEASDGESGLRQVVESEPDLVLLDMALPKMSGEEVIRMLKNNMDTAGIPVIAVTAQAMKGDKERILNLGCDAYVTKPVDQEVLLSEINLLLSK